MKKVDLVEYFSIVSPKQDDKINFEISTVSDELSIPFIGRSSSNNGVTDYVIPRDGLINKGNVITIALDGSTGSTFYQYHDFSSGQNIWMLVPKEEYFKRFNPKIALFMVSSIRNAVINYTTHWNLALTKTRLSNIKIYIPLNDDNTVDVDYIESKMNELRNIDIIDQISEDRYCAI